MLTGAALQVRGRVSGVVATVALAGIALGLGLGSCRSSRPAAPTAPAPRATAPADALTAAAPPPPRGKQIVMAYSSNLLGEYEPCG